MRLKNNNLREFEKFRIDLEKKILWCEGEPVQIPLKAVEMLCVLVENGGEVVTKEKLLEEVWHDSFVEESVLPQNVFHLRKTFKEHGLSANLIQTVPRRGYLFSGDVREIAGDAGDEIIIERETVERKIYAEISDDAEAISNEKAVGYAALPAAKKTNSRTPVIAAILLVLIAAAGFAVWQNYNESAIPAGERDIKSVAVLPLKNLNGDEPNQTLSLGIADNLISRLGSLNRFAVRPLSAVEEFQKGEADALDFGRKLKVDAVLDGTIQTDGNRLRVNVRLLDARDGAQIWAGSFDETEADVFKLQDKISIQIAGDLIGEISGRERLLLTKHDTENLDAYRLYAKGRFFLAKRDSPDLRRAAELFEEAIKLDPNYAAAYTSLADSYLLLSDSTRGGIEPREALEKARWALDKTLEINPESAEALATLGLLQLNHDWKIRAAEENFRRAVEINPNLPKAHHWFAWLLIVQKRFDEAEAEMKFANQLDPTSRIIATEIGYPAFFAGDYERAVEYFRQAVEMDRNFSEARFALWRALYQSGRFEEAFAEIEAIKNLSAPDGELHLIPHAQTLAATGNGTEARRIFDGILKRRKSGEYVSPLFLAVLAAELGEKNAAFEWLEVCFAERNDYMLYLETAPEFKNLRDDVRFQKLIARVGLNAGF